MDATKSRLPDPLPTDGRVTTAVLAAAMAKPTFETARLLLRAPAPGDAPAYALGISDYEVARFLTPVPYPYTLGMAIEYLRTAPEPTPERFCFVIELPGRGLVGAVTMAGELGFWIARRFWNRGLVTEAATAVLDWHFTETGREAVLCSAHHNNWASLAVQRKLGFLPLRRELRFSQGLGHNVEHTVTQLTRADWLARRTAA